MKKQTIILSIFFTLIITFVMSGTYTRAVLVPPVELQTSLVNQEPDPAIAGDIFEVRLNLQNIGGIDANDVMVELAPEYPFSPVAGEGLIQHIGSVQAYQGSDTEHIKTVKYKLRVDRDATAGSYALNIWTYENGSYAKVQKSFSVAVKSRENAEVIHIDKTNLIPGKQNSLVFRINNVGNAPLRDLTFHFENDGNIILPVGSDNTRYIKYIDIGGSEEIEYQVVADSNAAPGLYKLNLYLTYQNSLNSSPTTITTIAGIYVGGGTDFDVAFSESANNQVSFSIANIGSNPASSVSVMIPEQRGWRVAGSNAVIIGNLNKGDYTVASFKLQPPNSTRQAGSPRQTLNGGNQGNNNAYNTDNTSNQDRTNERFTRSANSTSDLLTFQIAYTDTMGERRVVEKQLKLSAQNLATDTNQAARASSNQSFISTYGWYIAGLLAILLGVYLYREKKQWLLLQLKRKS